MTQPSLPENVDSLHEIEQSGTKEPTTIASSNTTTSKTRRSTTSFITRSWQTPWVCSAAVSSTTLVTREGARADSCAIGATENWETLTGRSVPCPVAFDAKDVHETMKLDAFIMRWRGADGALGGMPEHHRLRTGELGAHRALRGGRGKHQSAEGRCIGGSNVGGRTG